jgi:hypothetical protein
MDTPRLQEAEAMGTQANKLVDAGESQPALFVNPPYLAPLKKEAGNLATAITKAQGGTDADQTQLWATTVRVRDLIKQHAAWVQSGANALVPADAVSFIIAAGFRVAKTGQRVTLTAPELTNGASTVVHYELPKVQGALLWFVELSTDGGKTFTPVLDTEKRKGDVRGLPSGQSVTLRFRARVRGDGYTPWSAHTILVT